MSSIFSLISLSSTLCLLLFIIICDCEEMKRILPKIGIIGGGIGGTSCAFFLRSLFGEELSIDLFEADKIGGRLSVVTFDQKLFEEGGSIIHPQNKYMVNFAELFQLKNKQPDDNYFGLYDGDEFVFSESKWSIITAMSLVYRYGFGYFKLEGHVNDWLKKFVKIYTLQEEGNTYDNVTSLLAALGSDFVSSLTTETKTGFEEHGVPQIVVDEIVMATLRANYGQNLKVHKMVEDSVTGTPLLPRNDAQMKIRQRIMGRRQTRGPILAKKEICYDMIGCFELPRKHSFKKPPQSPDMIDTKFWLYTRWTVKSLDLKDDEIVNLRKEAQLLEYGDNLESLRKSTFDPTKPTKVLIHGFKGSGKEKGALSGVQEFLKLEDVNVIVIDWEKGAADSYSTAAANTELIGRQTAVMLMDLLSYNASVKSIHVIGFSLGAHIAGCAGEMLKQNGYKLGRITGLDPASPLFKHHLLREPATKLDATKADFVDVIHTDGSPVFTDGFGLLRPVGHVDFFPNGGREQRGCSDGRGSVVVSHLEGTINSSVVCSHVRAWTLFLESVKLLQDPNGCQFVGFHCLGGNDKFVEGRCFVQPKERCFPNDPECNIMGMGASPNGARGALYLATRDSSPFCGEQLQVLVEISRKTEKTRGYLHMRLKHGDHFTNFKLSHEFSDTIEGGTSLSAIAVAEHNSISAPATPTVDALLSFQSLEFQTSQQNSPEDSKIISVDNIYINDSRGNRWYYCNKNSSFKPINGTTFSTLQIQLNLDPC